MYEIQPKTPLILVLYMTSTLTDPEPGIRWVESQYHRSGGGSNLLGIKATEAEQKLLLKILTMNAKYLPVGLKPKRQPFERDFQISFLLPLGPLSFEDLGRLNTAYGCEVCGEKSTKRCSQCQSASYCTPGLSRSMRKNLC